MITFLEAEDCDAHALKEIQVRSFSVDVNLCGDGPPGYDSIDWQLQKMKSHTYYKIIKDEIIVGGFYISKIRDGKYIIVRLFIDPLYQQMGIGGKALNFIETLFDDLKILELEASDFRKDNHLFYEKRGFVKIGEKQYAEDSFSYIYQKIIEE